MHRFLCKCMSIRNSWIESKHSFAEQGCLITTGHALNTASHLQWLLAAGVSDSTKLHLVLPTCWIVPVIMRMRTLPLDPARCGHQTFLSDCAVMSEGAKPFLTISNSAATVEHKASRELQIQGCWPAQTHASLLMPGEGQATRRQYVCNLSPNRS